MSMYINNELFGKVTDFDLASQPDYCVESLLKKSGDQVVLIKSRAIGKTVPICNLSGESIKKLMIQNKNRQLLPGPIISTL
ncbi:hypothetical protein [Acinetobacter bereziniae]|uniref:hypothetical protein n=1 Tax=Acinetobacter bereziniae TaxID=106648 RepID=UPI00215CA28F|nr:hypothetical protein [Acinetobacter bereziniae]